MNSFPWFLNSRRIARYFETQRKKMLTDNPIIFNKPHFCKKHTIQTYFSSDRKMLIIPIKISSNPPITPSSIYWNSVSRADPSDLLRPLPLDTQSTWRAWTLPRAASPPFSASLRSPDQRRKQTSGLTDAIHRVYFFFFFFFPFLRDGLRRAAGVPLPRSSLFPATLFSLFSGCREGRGALAPSTRPLSYFPPGNTAPTRKTIWMGRGGRRPAEKAHWLFTRKIRGACV